MRQEFGYDVNPMVPGFADKYAEKEKEYAKAAKESRKKEKQERKEAFEEANKKEWANTSHDWYAKSSTDRQAKPK